MAIYRGPGGSGDAVNDSSSETRLAVEARDAALAAQAAAEAAQAAAETAETNAQTAETNAETAETNAGTSATNAASSASSASTSATNAASSASAASTSATNAASSASSASTSATNAASSASSASSSASSASTSASNAATSATAAQAAQAAAEAAFDAFDDIYLGAKSSNPTVDNDGNALTTGDQYFNTVSNELRVWNGSSWQAASVIGGTVTSLTVTGATALNGGATLGDASGDALTINSSAVSIPNGLNFDSNTFVIDATNNRVGIGTDSPSSLLHLNNSSGNAELKLNSSDSGTVAITFGAQTDGATGSIGFYHSDNSLRFSGYNNSERMRIDSSGNVGIGTASPSSFNSAADNLVVGTTSGTNGITIAAGSAAQASIFFADGTATGAEQAAGYLYYYHPTDSMVLGTNNIERMRITSTGNVGIGTSSPTYPLDISTSNANATQISKAASDGYFALYKEGATTVGYIYSSTGSSNPFRIGAAGATKPLTFESNGLERMRLDSSGNLGLGVTPSAWRSNWKAFEMSTGALYDNGGSTGILQNAFRNTSNQFIYRATAAASQYDTYGGAHYWYTAPSGTAGNAITFTQAMTLDASGNLGIGTNSPSKKLDVNGDALIYGITVGRGAGAVASNTAVGNGALATNSTGTSNTAFGYQAGNSVSTNTNNTFVGYIAGKNTTGFSNTAVGSTAFYTNTSGVQSAAFGYGALSSNTTGSYNTATGFQSLYNNTTASYNTAVGYQAAYSNTTGVIDAFGNQALKANTTGISNSGIGNGALYSNTTGNNNVALGNSAALLNTAGNNNTALGVSALYSNTTASNNTAVGYQSLYSNTTGTENNALGKVSLYSNTTGNYNVAMGQAALYSNTIASQNTALGYQAGYTNVNGDGNTLIGFQAGYTTNYPSNGSIQNTFVGYKAGYYVSTGYKNTIIGSYNGNQGGLDIRTASNYIVLSDGDGNPRGYFNNNGYLFINKVGDNDLTQVQIYGNSNTGGTMHLTSPKGTNQSHIHYSTYGDWYIRPASNSGSVYVKNYVAESDARLKENIENISYGLSEVLALTPRKFNWVDGGEIENNGFIAQEVESVIPALVTEGQWKSVDYQGITAILVKAIQELKAEVDSLKQQLGK